MPRACISPSSGLQFPGIVHSGPFASAWLKNGDWKYALGNCVLKIACRGRDTSVASVFCINLGYRCIRTLRTGMQVLCALALDASANI
jgi:hypothetical protein